MENVDSLGNAVSALIRLEPSLKGRESEISVIVVTAFHELLKERGEVVVSQVKWEN